MKLIAALMQVQTLVTFYETQRLTTALQAPTAGPHSVLYTQVHILTLYFFNISFTIMLLSLPDPPKYYLPD